MKKTLLLLLSLFISGTCYCAIDLKQADLLYSKGTDFPSCEKELNTQLTKADNNKEKCEVLWRLARVYLLMGEQKSSKEEQRAIFDKGTKFASDAIQADPTNPNAYMWHCANAGRSSQTKGLKDQLNVVGIITTDLSTIIDKLHVMNMSEAWQAQSEMFYKHPFKSKEDAMNYGRKAVMTIPDDDIRLATYIFFAEMLNSRGNSASKRKSNIDDCAKSFAKQYKSTLEKYAFFEGSLGSSYVPKWSTKNLGSMSDKEEAMDIVNYAIKLYNGKADKTPRDNSDYKILQSYKNSWK